MAFERDPHKLFPHDRLLGATVIRLIPDFVTPNAITWFRFVLTPFVLYLIAIGDYRVGVPLFVFAAFTDALDGSLARLRGQVTEWGMLYDPIADKVLIGSVVLLVVLRHINPFFGVAIIVLEGMLVFGGLVRRRMGLPVMANVVGKAKMFLQFLGVTLLLMAVWSGIDLFIPFSIASLSLAIAFAVASLLTYGL
jgi:CDP-diacylglycerol--glycerol-3-phosphate 3-phosphatidyltransferase